MTEEALAALEALRALPKRARRAPALRALAQYEAAVVAFGAIDAGELRRIAGGMDRLAARVALEALARFEPDAELGIVLLELLPDVPAGSVEFLLGALDRHVEDGLVALVLEQAGPGWPQARAALRELVAHRPGEEVVLGDIPDDRLDAVVECVRGLGDLLPAAVGEDLDRRRRMRELMPELSGIGRVWRGGAASTLAQSIVIDDALERELDTLEAGVRAGRPQLLVGELGTGRTSRLHALGARLAARGWVVFEAGASEINAGQSYVGQLEGRIQTLVRTLADAPVLWIAPEFEALLWAGTHRHSQTGMLDMLLAALHSGAVHVVGEITPSAHEQLLRARPAVREAFDSVRVEPADEPRTLALARGWAERAAPGTHPRVLRESIALAGHFLAGGAQPGATLALLQAAARRADGAVALPDLLAAVSERSGLPLSLLDERERLDIDAVRHFFASRVVGQPEAVECVVERVALVKAGLTDPTRPQAVLLFVGPTGTGKTEIAKALAEFLFGSADRMVRIDLSEYQNPGAARRLIGEAEFDDPSLLGKIRRQPFSVVLLDEFEKADTGVWDLFLQVFDDGRLSDPRGDTADFRHAVIIMTSNLGARIAGGAGVGFSPTGGFTAGSVTQAVTRAFRPEFLNRIDRTVVFRPLSRPVMRDILEAELHSVLARRGLRQRDWAVEWDDSALEFLLAAGFTPDLGARPLKRAVERHFLTPLALAIAAHDYPTGDQFLFVSAGKGGLEVTFVDPDAPAGEPATPPAADAPVTLLTLAREGGDGRPVLRDAYQALRERVEDEHWQAAKAALLARVAEPGFWDDDGRVAVLAGVELRDRIEAGLRSAGSLLGRIGGTQRPPSSLVRRAAQRLMLLREALDALAADEPADALLRVDAAAAGREFALRVTDMYRGWAHERGMRLEVVEERSGGRDYRLVCSVGGFGSLRVLAPEAGLHVLEAPDGHGGFERRRVRVSVAPDVPGGPPALDALAAAAAGRARIVRRYRERPTPLVRDSVRGWRTGRLDFVLAGGFDLIE